MKKNRSTMNVIFSQCAPYRLRIETGRGSYEPTIYARFEAKFAPQEHVLVCGGKCETFSEDVPLMPTLRCVTDMESLRNGDYEAHAVRMAVRLCDVWFEDVRLWCVDHSDAQVAPEAQP